MVFIKYFKGKYHVLGSHNDKAEMTTLQEKLEEVLRQRDNHCRYDNENYVKFPAAGKNEQTEEAQVLKTGAYLQNCISKYFFKI